MAKTATTRSDILENEIEAASGMLLRAGILLFVSLSVLYLCVLIGGRMPEKPFFLTLLKVVSVLGAVCAVALGIVGGLNLQRARAAPSVEVNCPFCDRTMQFPSEPTIDWDCEGCHRRVPYEDGAQVPIREITCTFCKSVHKISIKTTQYTCDRCNRALKLVDPKDPTKIVAEQSDILQNYDVVLTDPGRDKTAVAMHLQGVLICNLIEARKQMENLPLTVMRNVPERKADAERRRFRDLGATCVVRPTASQDQPAGRT